MNSKLFLYFLLQSTQRPLTQGMEHVQADRLATGLLARRRESMSLWETSSRKLVPLCGGGRAVVGAEGRSPQAEVGRPPLALEPACLAHKRQPGCGLPCGSCSVRGGGRQAPTPTSVLEPLPPSSSHCGPAAAGAHSRRGSAQSPQPPTPAPAEAALAPRRPGGSGRERQPEVVRPGPPSWAGPQEADAGRVSGQNPLRR